MPALKFDLSVEMEGGKTYTVVADQRDVSRYEQHDVYGRGRKHTMLRFLAWAASRRQGLTPEPWEMFDANCIEVGDALPEAEPLDPGRPDPRTANSSASSGGPAAG